MEHLTCVVDATTLVDRVHEIKQWVYNDAIRIHIPLSTFEKVEQIYQASLASKEPQKEPAPKKTSSKAARKETPLFDINPRTAREFLLRAQGANLSNVSFQLPYEQFTQWKDEEQQAIKVEQPPQGPPTSFAEALRRKKLNDGLDYNGNKGPSKPKLVARSSSPKSPWKYHKVPTIASSEVPPVAKPLFSCMLWRLHEFENNPLMPEIFVILSNDHDIRVIAQKLGIPVKYTQEIGQAVKEQQAGNENRATEGELEREFSQKKVVENEVENGGGLQHASVSSLSNEFDFGVETILEQDEEIEELKKTISNEKVINGALEKVDTTLDITSNGDIIPSGDMIICSKPGSLPTPETTSSALFDSSIDEVEPEIETLLNIDSAEPKASLFSYKQTTLEITPSALFDSSIDEVEPEIETLLNIDSAEPKSSLFSHEQTTPTKLNEKNKVVELPLAISQLPHHEKKEPVVDVEEESDDDDEVVVFTPISKRFSGLPKTSTEPPRPKTADATNGVPQFHALPSPLKPHLATQLKPQSPVFIPKSDQHLVDTTAQPQKDATVNATVPTPMSIRNNTQTPIQPPIQPQRRVHKPQNIRSEGSAQRHSREIIERQREVISRQVRAPSKPVPRQIQMQPTSSPTVIDPDAFDRSYVVQSPSIVPNGTNGNHRTPGRRGSPKRVPRTQESEIDFVLKSGSPRGSTRGRGKLWVP